MSTESEIRKYRALYKNQTPGDSYGHSAHYKCALPLVCNNLRKCRSVLDVGTGHGEFLAFCLDELRVWSALGLDPGLPTTQIETPGGRVVVRMQTTVTRYARYSRRSAFDWVTSWDVLEHLPPEDVSDTLDAMWSLTRKGLLVSVASCSDKRRVGGQVVELHPTQWPSEQWADAFHALRPESVSLVPGDRPWRHVFLVTKKKGT